RRGGEHARLELGGAARVQGEGARIQSVVDPEGEDRDEQPHQHRQGAEAAQDLREQVPLPSPQGGAEEREDQQHQAADPVERPDRGADDLPDVLAVGPLPQRPLQPQLEAQQIARGDPSVMDVLRRGGLDMLGAQDSNHDRLPSATFPPPTRSMKVWTRLPPRRTSSSVPSAMSRPSAMIATWLHSPSTSSIA